MLNRCGVKVHGLDHLNEFIEGICTNLSAEANKPMMGARSVVGSSAVGNPGSGGGAEVADSTRSGLSWSLIKTC